jgi:hypothetical protein
LDRPSLIVVGTGIRIIGQMTTESVAWIKTSQKVLYLEHDPTAADIIRELNPSAESLAGFYAEGKPRRQSLEEMVERVMECVRSGKRTCLVTYGHPGVFCWPGHEAIRQASRAGFTARMLPGVSSEDCLFADLGLDPATHGCQSYEAMDFLESGRQIDPSSLLILWQIGVMGDPMFKPKGYDLSPLPLLVERLCRVYRPNHKVIVYVAGLHWGSKPLIKQLPLRQLANARLSASSTLCIPPGRPTRPDAEIARRLKLLLPEEKRRRRSRRSRKQPKLSGKSSPRGSRCR